jgi:hypothetical protein
MNQLLIWIGQKSRLDAPIYSAALSFVIQGEISPENLQFGIRKTANLSGGGGLKIWSKLNGRL